MGVLNRTPEGFLDLTGQRVGGRYPTQLSDVVAPTVDVSTLLDGRLIASETDAQATSNLLDTASITVPDNENWQLFQVATLIGPMLNTDRYHIGVRLTNLPGSSSPANFIYIAYNDNRVSTGLVNNRYEVMTRNFARPIALAPGTVVEAIILDKTGANNIPWALECGVYKLVGN